MVLVDDLEDIFHYQHSRDFGFWVKRFSIDHNYISCLVFPFSSHRNFVWIHSQASSMSFYPSPKSWVKDWTVSMHWPFDLAHILPEAAGKHPSQVCLKYILEAPKLEQAEQSEKTLTQH